MHFDAEGYVRPRAGGGLKRYDVPIAIGKLVKAGMVAKVGGTKVEGLHYAGRK